jgi:hypothetical protein
VRVDRGEGDIAAPLSAAVAAFPDVSFGSYPFQRGDGHFGVDIVLRGPDGDRLGEAEAALRASLGAA